MWLGTAGGCAAVASVYLILRIVGPSVSSGRLGSGVTIFLSVAGFMLVQLLLIRCVAGMGMRAKTAGLLALPSMACVVGITMLLAKVDLPALAVAAAAAFRDLALMFFAALLGQAVSFIVREPNILLPAAIAAAVVDYWSLSWGPLRHFLTEHLDLVEAASVQMPSLGQAVPISMIGMGDFVFLALFFAVLYRFRMNVAGTFWLGYVLLTISMLAVLCFSSAVPALVPICVAVVVANIRHFQLKRGELFAVLYVGILVVAVLAAMGVFLFRR